MFGSNSVGTSSFSLGGIVGGLNKALNVANQVLPLYQKAQPILKNAKSVFGVLKNISITDKEKTTSKPLAIQDPDEPSIITKNSPVFFQ